MHPLDPEGSTLCLWPVLVQKEERGLLTVSELRGSFLAPSVLHEDSRDVLSSLKFIHTRRKGTSSLCFLSVLVRRGEGRPLNVSESHGNFLSRSISHEDSTCVVVGSSKFIRLFQRGAAVRFLPACFGLKGRMKTLHRLRIALKLPRSLRFA